MRIKSYGGAGGAPPRIQKIAAPIRAPRHSRRRPSVTPSALPLCRPRPYTASRYA